MQSLGAFLWSWASIDILIGCAAVAVAVIEPPWLHRLIPNLRTFAVYTAIVAFTLAGAIAHGYKNGLAEKQRQWDAALVKEVDRGEQAASDAADLVGPMSTDRSLFRGDPFNRDRGKSADR